MVSGSRLFCRMVRLGLCSRVMYIQNGARLKVPKRNLWQHGHGLLDVFSFCRQHVSICLHHTPTTSDMWIRLSCGRVACTVKSSQWPYTFVSARVHTDEVWESNSNRRSWMAGITSSGGCWINTSRANVIRGTSSLCRSWVYAVCKTSNGLLYYHDPSVTYLA